MAFWSRGPAVSAIIDNNLVTLQLCLVDFDYKFGVGVLLHYCAYYDAYECAEWLILQGANVNAKDGGGLLPLYNCVRNYHNMFNYRMAQLFIQHGADTRDADLISEVLRGCDRYTACVKGALFLFAHGAVIPDGGQLQIHQWPHRCVAAREHCRRAAAIILKRRPHGASADVARLIAMTVWSERLVWVTRAKEAE